MIVAITGILLASLPFGRWLEEDIGLSWLFKIRGPQTAPAEVVIVSIDQASSSKLKLPNKPRKWPRALHAKLVDKLTQHGVSSIFFDIIFEEMRDPDHNRLFANAMKKAGNVILFQYTKQENITLDKEQIHVLLRLVSPIDTLRDAAFGLAPFPLPKVPAQVNHFLLFKPELNAATAPVVALQTHAIPVYTELLELLVTHVPGQLASLPKSMSELKKQGSIQNVSLELRRIFKSKPELAGKLFKQISQSEKLKGNQKKLLAALVNAYQAPHSMYLNFYGPPRTIRTLSYHEVLSGKQLDLKDKAVFVGFSEQFQPEQKDGFYTVYTEEHSGLDISGVEIIATAFANLLDRRALSIPDPWIDIIILFSWALLLGIGLRSVPGPAQIPAAIILTIVYSIVNYYSFNQHSLWLPLAIPVLWQVPLATLATLLWKYIDVQRERRNIRQAFGYHLPVDVVDQLAEGIDHITADGQQVEGIVLATDAQQYTSLSENMAPEPLRQLMNQYYETLFTPVRNRHGVISDVVGDAALAIWASTDADTNKRKQACLAALDIITAVDEFNSQHPDTPLPTRIGLDYGDIVMGHVGAIDHYEYRAVGDIVNTATRIEGLNKILGTRILVSDAVLKRLDGLISRNVGVFMLKGKQQAVTVHELIGMTEKHPGANFDLFSQALGHFQAGKWAQAIELFENYLERQSKDGPCRYYLEQCKTHLTHPPEKWDGIIRLDQK